MPTIDRPEFHEPKPDPSTKLSIEHQFYFVTSIRMAEAATKEQLLELFRHILLSYLTQQEYYQALVKTTWGLDSGIDKRPTTEELADDYTEDSGY